MAAMSGGSLWGREVREAGLLALRSPRLHLHTALCLVGPTRTLSFILIIWINGFVRLFSRSNTDFCHHKLFPHFERCL